MRAEAGRGTRARIAAIACLLVAFNLAAWAWAAAAFHHRPLLLGTALLAYSFGLRHAVDADHIAAIDNVTRARMQEGERPVAVGLFFSLGHSTVVLVGSMLLARLAALFSSRLAAVRDVGGLIGTLVSATFLFAIAVLNLAVLRSTWRSFRRVRRGEACAEQDLDLLLCGGGPMSRLFRSLFRLIRSSWAMYPLGLLFGLGFDTATEIGLLGISAQQASRGLPLWQIVVFPVLFAAGMSLVDTADNLLMLGAYGWALLKPVRKLYYNLTITALSVVLACVVGGLEILGLAGERLHRLGTPWRWIEGINDHFGLLGYGIVGLFVVSWIGSIAIYRLAGLEHPAEPQASLRPR